MTPDRDGTALRFFTFIQRRLSGRITCAGLTAVALVSFFALAVAACGKISSQTPDASSNRTDVVATIFPLYDIASRIAGDAVPVRLILPPGRSPHDYELTPADRLDLRNADLVILAGGGVDSWFEEPAHEQTENGVTVVNMFHLITGEDESHAEHDGHDHTHAGPNPHVWLVPENARKLVEAIRAHLIEQHPMHKIAINERAERLVAELIDLDNQYRTTLSAIPDRRMITFHDAFDPLAEAYDLDVVAHVYSVDAQQITPSVINSVQNHINEGIRAVFVEPQFDPQAAQRFNDVVTLRTLDPLGGRLQPPGYDSYVHMMRSNLRVLAEGLAENTSGDGQTANEDQ